MALAWFITVFKRDERPGAPGPARYCAMDDYTPLIYGEGGRWAETEVLGNYALVKVRASQATLDTIAVDPVIFRIPLNHLDLRLGDLTPQQRNALQDRVIAMGYTAEEIKAVLGNNWADVTLGQVLHFAASRRRKPRYDAVQDEIVLDGIIQACRQVESVDAEVTED